MQRYKHTLKESLWYDIEIDMLETEHCLFKNSKRATKILSSKQRLMSPKCYTIANCVTYLQYFQKLTSIFTSIPVSSATAERSSKIMNTIISNRVLTKKARLTSPKTSPYLLFLHFALNPARAQTLLVFLFVVVFGHIL